MSFDVFGPTRHVRASTIDDGGGPAYDLLALPQTLALKCPVLHRLHQRFYETTQVEFVTGDVTALRDELELLQRTYRQHLEPRLIRQRGVRARDPQVQDAIIGKLCKATLRMPPWRSFADCVKRQWSLRPMCAALAIDVAPAAWSPDAPRP